MVGLSSPGECTARIPWDLLIRSYDYEECESEGAEAMIDNLRKMFAESSFVGKELGSFKVKEAGDFSYTDPIDGSVSKKQGLYIKFEDGSRIIFRLSGTGSSGATVRLYVEKYSKDEKEYPADAQVGLKPLIDVALQVSELQKYTGRDKPDVITVSSATPQGARADACLVSELVHDCGVLSMRIKLVLVASIRGSMQAYVHVGLLFCPGHVGH